MKKLLATMATAAILTVSAGTVSAASFNDVPPGHWATAQVNFVADEGILVGYGDDSFRGDNEISRGELMGAADALSKKFMSDSNVGNEYLQKWILTGQDGKATRYDVAEILAAVYREVYDINDADITESANDVDSEHKADVDLVLSMGIMESYGDGSFRGDKTMTRYEAAIILSKFYNKLAD